MTQQYIDFGSFPDDPSADSIRESFQKTQDNFTDLYTNSLKQGVMELVSGAGLHTQDDRITGNLVLYANIPRVTFKTTSSLVVRPEASSSFANVAIINDTTPIVIGLSNSISTVNANFTGTTTINDLNVHGLIKTSLIPQGQDVLDLGSAEHRWRDLFLSGNTLTIGTQTIKSTTDGFDVSAGLVTSNLSVGTVEADFVGGLITTANQPSITNVGILQGLAVDGDITTGTISVVGNLDSYAVNAATMSVSGVFTAGTITGNIVLPPGATLDAPGGAANNMSVMFNDGGKAAAVPGLAYNKTTSLLTIQGNVEGGNLITSGAMSVTMTASVGNLATGGDVTANSGTISGGNIISLGILTATDTVTGGNLSTSGYLTVTGNASVGNITTTNVNGVQVSVSGNVSGANLVASGILKVDGAANVGSLTTSGLISAATLQTSGNANISGNINTTNGDIVTTNGKLAGGSLYSSGLADITGDFLGRSNVTAEGILTVVGNSSLGNVTSSGALSVTGNASIGNISTTGISATGNLSGGNLNILGVLRAGDSDMANINATGALSVTGTATAGNVYANSGMIKADSLSSNSLTSTGNVSGGNLKTGGATIYANGYISGADASLATVVGTLFQGSGANLSTINGANVSKVASATAADTATTAGTSNTVTVASQPNITSLGTLTSLTLSGAISGATSISGTSVSGGNITASGFFVRSVASGISATGTTQGTAYILTKEFNVVTSASTGSSDSIRLPATVAGLEVVIINASTSAIKVYPASGSLIDKNGTDTPAVLGVDGKLVLYSTSSTQWYSLSSIYS